MTVNVRPVSCITKSIFDLKQAEEALVSMLSYALNKKDREDFTAEEWENFIFCFQLVSKLEYSLRKVKLSANSWYQMSNESEQ